MTKLITLLIAACLAVPTVNATPAPGLNNEHKVDKDIVFKRIGNKEIKLDLYTPALVTKGKIPLLIWVHGGAWKRGTKNDIPSKNPLLLESVLSKNYALAAIDYRLSGEATYPAAVVDINDAINYLYDNAGKYNIDVENIVMMGRSAGGHLAGLMGVTNGQQGAGIYAKPKYKVKAVVSFFGPTDLLALGVKRGKKVSLKAPVSRFLGGSPTDIPDMAKQASTIHYVDKNTPPFIQFHGTLDKQVPVGQSVSLKQELDKHGVKNQLFIEEGVGHSAAVFDSDKYVPRVIDFLALHFPSNGQNK